MPDATCSDLDREVCIASGGNPRGPGTTCATTLCDPPEACCLPDETCENLVPFVCANRNGQPRGPGTACDRPVCNPRACCFVPGFCEETSQFDCLNRGGTPGAKNSICANTQCPQTIACCYRDGTCEDVDSSITCAFTMGRSQGLGSSCQMALCNLPAKVRRWRIMRIHGILGELGVPLKPAANGNGVGGPAVEPRQGALQRIEVEFDQDVMLMNPGAVMSYPDAIMGPPVSYPASVSMSAADRMAIDYPPGMLPDHTCYEINLAGAVQNSTGWALDGDTDCMIRVLTGDATMSGDSTLSDALLTKLHSGESASASPEFDLDLDGLISPADAQVAKSRVASPARKALCP
jgi:hypothetical protein